jgi:hypothetical protein
MRANEFMRAIPAATRPHLPPDLKNFEWRARPWLVQIHYGQPQAHYEVWSLRRRNLLEVGLHFEHRDRSLNTRLLNHFDAHAVAINPTDPVGQSGIGRSGRSGTVGQRLGQSVSNAAPKAI